MAIRTLRTRAELVAFAREHELREDWHEPDEQDVDAFPAIGHSFDNAAADPADFRVEYARRQDEGGIHATVFSALPAREVAEHGVFLFVGGEPAAFVNLADLFAWACGGGELALTEEEERAILGIFRSVSAGGYDDLNLEPLRSLALRMEDRA